MHIWWYLESVINLLKCSLYTNDTNWPTTHITLNMGKLPQVTYELIKIVCNNLCLSTHPFL